MRPKLAPAKPKLIDFWVFGPEYGCLYREIPIIDKLVLKYRIRIICHAKHNGILRSRYGDNVIIENYRYGINLFYKENFDLDLPKSFLALTKYLMYGIFADCRIFLKLIKKEKPALLINDFLPQVSLFAILKGIPVWGVYNYLLKNTSLGKGFYRRIIAFSMKYAYRLSYYINKRMFVESIEKGLGKSISIPSAEVIPPIALKKVMSREDIDNLIAGENKPLIFISIGGNSAPEYWLGKFNTIAKDSPNRFLCFPRSYKETEKLKKKFSSIYFFYKESISAAEIIMNAGLVITKAGFTTVSECLKYNVPMLLFSLPNHSEIYETEQILLKNNLVKDRILGADVSDIIKEKIEKSLNFKVPKVECNGADIIAKEIKRFLSQT